MHTISGAVAIALPNPFQAKQNVAPVPRPRRNQGIRERPGAAAFNWRELDALAPLCRPLRAAEKDAFPPRRAQTRRQTQQVRFRASSR